MSKRIVVIGAGPGGYIAALRAAALGAEVTIIEQENIGGTCLNWGCIPSKIMKTTADMYLKFHESPEYGIAHNGDFSVDMAALMARKRRIITTQQQGIHALLKKGKVAFEKGRGVVDGPNLAAVITDDGQKRGIPFDALILATGTAPMLIPAFPFDGKTILSSNHLLELESVPESIVIAGGGVIGCEFAFILSALGAKVTLVEAMDRILPLDAVDESCSKIIHREMKKQKIKVIIDRAVSSIARKEGGVIVSIGASPFSDKDRAAGVKEQVVEAQTMAVCIGRTPLSRDLGLETIGLSLDERGWIPVNNRMETQVKDVYAIGDILGPSRIMLAHAASHEGMVAAENIMGMDSAMDYTAVPGAIFTMPEVGNVGLSERMAVKKGFDVECTSVNFRTLGKAQVMGEIAGEVKIVADKKTGKVLGVHITGPHATDLIAEGTLAVQNGLYVEDLARTIHAHPTLAEIMGEVSLKARGCAIHA